MMSAPFGRGRGLCAAALALLFLPLTLAAQQTGAITGTVTDAGSLEPLAGAQVFIQGTDLGTLTGPEGRYRIENVPAGTHEVRVRLIGYQPVTESVEVSAGQVSTADFQVNVSAIALDEVVATVSGVQRRREAGHSIATISAAEEVERSAPPNVTNLIQGRAAGVQVLQSSGTVGGASTIKVRGNTSISLDNTPLIFIDGARVSNNITSGPAVGGQTASRLNDLNPEDIESIEVIKGPAASSLYGSEAAAGVVVIHTKRGQAATNNWNFRAEAGGNWDDTDWPVSVINPRGLLGEELCFAPGLCGAVPDTLYSMRLLAGESGDVDFGTPWRTGLEQQYGASLRGGIDRLTYYVSGEWNDQEGSLPNNEFTRLNGRGNFGISPSEKVDISVSTGFTTNQLFLPDNDNNGFGYLGVAMIGFPWDMPVNRQDLVTGEEVLSCPLRFEVHRAAVNAGIGELVPLASQSALCPDNPFFGGRTFDDVATIESEQSIERFTGSLTADYRPWDFLAARATVGYDEFSDQTSSFFPVDPNRPFSDLSEGFRSINNIINRNLTLTGSLEAAFQLTDDLRSTTTVGAQFGQEKLESAGSLGRFLPSGTKTVSNAVITEGFESIVETRAVGVFIQEQLGYKDRLFVTPALRLDDNSAFGEELGMQVWPRVMASYVISDEDFFPEFFDSFRLRGAWGMSGKQPSSFAALQLLDPTRVTFEGEDRAGISLTRPANLDLRPETGRELELGFETEFLDSRIGLDFTWFNQNTEDAIVARQMAPSTGFSSPRFVNVGEMRTRGLELALNALAVDQRDIRWDWRVNVSTNKGEILELDNPIIFGLGGNSQRHQVGFPFASYFDFAVEVGPDGEPRLVADTMVFLGHPTPEWEGSVSTSVTLLDHITLYGNLGFAGGHQLINFTEQFQCGFLGGGRYGSICPETFERGPDGEFTDESLRKQFASNNGYRGPWVEDADFARLRTVSARFEFPESLLRPLRANRASFTLVAENLATWTGYTGLDPEINFGGGSQTTRADFLTLPPAKRITGQLSVTF